jgi:hypothetical protein
MWSSKIEFLQGQKYKFIKKQKKNETNWWNEMNKEQQKTEKLIVKVISEAQKYHTLLAQQRVSFVFRYKQLNQSKS